MRILVVDGGEATVRNSTSVGNRVFGLDAGNRGAVIDAAYNWWGQPTGPVTEPAPIFGGAIPEQQVVFGAVMTAPWKTQAQAIA